LLVNVVELLRDPGRQRHLSTNVDPAEVGAAHPTIDAGVTLDVDLRSTLDDIVVTGWLEIPWASACRRCLRPLREALRVDVDEHYAENPELVERGQAFPIDRGQLDLAPLVHDEVLLAAASERLCRPDCAGLCPACGRDRNDASTACACDAAPVDDRWSVLDQLRDAE
jgi:uncharacterized protein